MNWIDEYIDQYCKWIKANTRYKTDEYTGWTAISTPFNGLFNDPIEIYVKRRNENELILSDDGQTIHNLELVGVVMRSNSSRKKWLDYILLNYGIKNNNGELTCIATPSSFAQKNHDMICAISAISDMEVTAKSYVSSMFNEDVKRYFDAQNLIYTPQFIAKGSTGIDFSFDFQIAGRNNELVVKSFPTLNRTMLSSFLFSVGDIQADREKLTHKHLKSLAIIDDTNRDVKTEYISAIRSKDVDVMLWSKREERESKDKLLVA